MRQKHWFHRRGLTPEWFYNLMVRFGAGRQRVGRFQGRQKNWIDRLGESAFLSRRHVDWSRTKAYALGNFGQIFVNLKGRQPNGCVAPEDYRGYVADLKGRLGELRHPETGGPLVERVLEREELYEGPMAWMAPDLTVILGDWRYRTIGLHDFTTHRTISKAFGPTGDHRMDGIFVGCGSGFRNAGRIEGARLEDVTPTILALLGAPIPDDADGRALTEALEPEVAAGIAREGTADADADAAGAGNDDSGGAAVWSGDGSGSGSDADEESVRRRLADLGYL